MLSLLCARCFLMGQDSSQPRSKYLRSPPQKLPFAFTRFGVLRLLDGTIASAISGVQLWYWSVSCVFWHT